MRGAGMITPDYWRRWTGERAMTVYRNRAGAAAAIGAAWGTMAGTGRAVQNAIQGEAMPSRKRDHHGNLRGGHGWTDVGGDAQGPGQCRTGRTANIWNSPEDASLVRIIKKKAKWLLRWKDKRELIKQILFPQNLISLAKNVDPMVFTGEPAVPGTGVVQEILQLVEWDNGDLSAQPSVGAALSSDATTPPTVAGAPGGVLGMQEIAGLDAGLVYKTSGNKDAFADGKIHMPHQVARYRFRNTSMRPAKLRIYEFDCIKACGSDDTPLNMWNNKMPQQVVNGNNIIQVIARMNDATGDTWQGAGENQNNAQKPFSRPQGYHKFWKLSNQSTLDLKPSKQLVYTTKMVRTMITNRGLQEEISNHTATGFYPGCSKVTLVVLMGDSVTKNDGSGKFGFSDTKIAVERETQFVSNVLWAYRPKTVRLSIEAERGVGNYYNELPTASQGGTLTGVGTSFTDAGFAYDADQN